MSKKVNPTAILYVSIDANQHERLRRRALDEHCTLSDVVRQALDAFEADHPTPDHAPSGEDSAPRRPSRPAAPAPFASPFKKKRAR